MDRKAVAEEYIMLQEDVCRMFLTDDVAELVKMYEFAQKRIERIYRYHCARLDNN